MKYMGSKKNMLSNGLGEVLERELINAKRVVDLFCGSASVSWHIATNFDVHVTAVDLQKFSAVLGNAVLKRTCRFNSDHLWKVWLSSFNELKKKSNILVEAENLDLQDLSISSWSIRAQNLCSELEGGVVWNSYGGYYYSPTQSINLDLLVDSIPFEGPMRDVCLASVIVSASKCAAAPGHTAQPFKPNKTAGPYLEEAWNKDVLSYTKDAFESIANTVSLQKGEALVGDALGFIKNIKSKDVVFIDPPYSNVQYSRFYHVLETVARRECGEISGIGRYPPFEERPISSFSRKSEAEKEFEKLLSGISKKGAKVILTYPDKDCSNGLSGDRVYDIANGYFDVNKKIVDSVFSTMGGNNIVRSSRKKTNEMILVLSPN